MDFKERGSLDAHEMSLFEKAKEWEFDIIDEFEEFFISNNSLINFSGILNSEFFISNNFKFNIENNCWQSKYKNYQYSTLKIMYKSFLKIRNIRK